MLVKKNAKFISIPIYSLCIVARVKNCNQNSCKNQLEMDMFMSINGDDEIYIYILDNLFSFCHKDGMLAWGIGQRVLNWRLEERLA